MSIYIIRPKQTLTGLSLTLSAMSMAPQRRDAQVKEIIRLRKADPTYQEIERWLTDAYRIVSVSIPPVISTLTVAAETVASAANTIAEAVSKVAQTSLATPEQKASANQRAMNVHKTEITGTIIVDMSDAEAARMRQELPDVIVQKDEPIHLIYPHLASNDKAELSTADLWHLKAIGLEQARKAGFQGSGAGVEIALLDTGIDETHEELKGKISGAFTFDVDKRVTQLAAPSIDTEGHGTHVAGLICGQVVGIAPGAKLLSGIMLPGGRGSLASFILALEWAAGRHEVQIMNMSAGISGYWPEMQAPLEDLASVGILSVVATGNEGPNKTRSPGNYVEPLSVGAAERRENRYSVASFSSGGRLIVDSHAYYVPDVVAPGDEVYSCKMGGGYRALSGTSMAAPIVSGIAALILEKYKDITVLQLKEELCAVCLDLGLPPERQGRGLIQVKME